MKARQRKRAPRLSWAHAAGAKRRGLRKRVSGAIPLARVGRARAIRWARALVRHDVRQHLLADRLEQADSADRFLCFRSLRARQADLADAINAVTARGGRGTTVAARTAPHIRTRAVSWALQGGAVGGSAPGSSSGSRSQVELEHASVSAGRVASLSSAC